MSIELYQSLHNEINNNKSKKTNCNGSKPTLWNNLRIYIYKYTFMEREVSRRIQAEWMNWVIMTAGDA